MQFDLTTRVVSEPNLRAMCARESSMCHTYHVDRVTKNRAYVVYSNPSEYGTPQPMTLVLPVVPFGEARGIVLSPDFITAVYHDNWHGEGWQAFWPLFDCPPLYRSGPESDDWATEAEINARKAEA